MIKTLACVVLATASILAAPAMALDKPKGEVILTVTGKVDHPNVGSNAEFDLEMLELLASRSGTMETPWTTGSVTFSGPLLSAVLDAAGARGETITVKALNDYAADLPMADAREFETMLATRMDGKPMSVRDKGPLFLIYPFDTKPDLYNEKYFARSVWQIKEIEVK